MNIIKLFYFFIGSPDGRQTGRLCRHNIHTDPVVHAQIGNARSYKFHNFIFYISTVKYFSDDRKRDILRTYTLRRCSGQIYADHARHIDIVCLTEQLFYQLRSAFPDRHGSKRPVAGMGIGSKDHFSAACKHFTGELMDNCLMRRYIDSAVLLCAGQSKHVVIFIDRSTYRTQTVVAVGKDVRNREFFQSGCPGCLNNTDKCDIVGCQLVKFDLKLFHAAGCVVLF